MATLLLGYGSPRALTDEELFREFGFAFTVPGARNLGMAGAASATANDATAAMANPAGLHFVTVPEFFAEVSYTTRDTQVYRSQLGSLDVDLVTGQRDLPYLGLTSVNQVEDATDFSSFSAVWPMQIGRQQRRLNLSLSMQKMLSEEKNLSDGEDVTEARFAFESFPNTVVGGMIQAYSVGTRVTGSSDTDIYYWNFSGSYEISRDFSIGATVTYATLDMQAGSVTGVEDPLQLFLDPGHPRYPALPAVDVYSTRVDGTDSDVAWTLGVHLHPDSAFASGFSPWRFGAVYRKGAAFAVQEQTYLNGLPDQTFANNVIVPDRYSFAVSYQATRRWLISAEYERIEYSDMMEGYQSGVNYLTSGRVAGEAFPIDPDVSVNYTVDDGSVPRLGVEYARELGAEGKRSMSFWGGYYRQPDSRIRMTQFNSTDPDVNATYLDAFRGGEPSDHFTVGGGYSTGRHAFQLAGDISDISTRVVGSYLFRWTSPKPVVGTLGEKATP